MNETGVDSVKTSARDKVDQTKNPMSEPKHLQHKEKLLSKHKRIMSNDIQLSGFSNHFTAETGCIGNMNNNHLPRHTIKKDDLMRPLKVEHRRVQSNIIETFGPSSYSSLSKNKEVQEMVKKCSAKTQKQREICLKKQSKPTELITGSQFYRNPSKNLVSAGSSNHLGQSSNKSTKKSKLHKPTHSMFTTPFEQLIPRLNQNAYKRNTKNEFKKSLKGLNKDEAKPKVKKKEERGYSTELTKKNWSLSLKTTKYFLAAQNLKKSKTGNSKKSPDVTLKSGHPEPIKKKPSMDKEKEPKGILVKNPSGILSQPDSKSTKPKTSEGPNSNHHSRKGHHKKIPSLPAPNPTARLIENLNLPITMNSKQITMTPDESRRTSPRPSRPPNGPVQSSRRGSFIIEEDIQEDNEHYFSHLLYSKQKEEENTRNIHLNFCEDSQDEKDSKSTKFKPRKGSQFKPGTRQNSKRSNTSRHNYLVVNDKNSASNQIAGRGTPARDHQIKPLSESAVVGGFVIDEPSKYTKSFKSFSKDTVNGLQSSPQRGTKVDQSEAHIGESKKNVGKGAVVLSSGDDMIQDKSEVPMVLQKLMLITRIKEFYAKDTLKDIQTGLDFYRIVKRIGQGSFGKVYQAVSILTGKEVAIKKFDKAEVKTEMAKQKIFQEAKILNMLDHPNIARLLEVFENKGNIFCVMEYAKEGDILNLIRNQGPLDEKTARFIIIQVAHGLKHCHSKNVLHRDIKLDNVLLSDNYTAKLCDFGISRVVKKDEIIFEDCGTPAYTAPELVSGKGYSGFQADVWSMGIMLFVMVTGKMPFKDKSMSQEILHQLILKGDFSFPPEINLSEDLKHLISRMLCVDPSVRITIDQIISDQWFDHPMIQQLTSYLKNAETGDNVDYAMKKVLDLGFPESNANRVVKKQILNHIHCCYQIYRHN